MGKQMILIRFKEPRNGLAFVLLGENCAAFGELSGNGVRIRASDCYIASNKWNSFISGYNFVKP